VAIWEGVVGYLTPAAVDQDFRTAGRWTVQSRSAKPAGGSRRCGRAASRSSSASIPPGWRITCGRAASRW
jgi:hypothetical protein